MTNEDLLVPSPFPGSDEPWVRAERTRFPVSEVMHYLSVSGSPEGVLNANFLARESLTLAGVNAAIEHAIGLLSERKPGPPVVAALLKRLSWEGIIVGPEQIERWARELASTFDGQRVDVEHLTTQQIKSAYQYLASLSRNGNFARPTMEDDRSIRDELNTHDLKLVNDRFTYQSEIAHYGMTPERNRDRWVRLIEEFEGGYDDEYAELTNDLDGRDILQDAAELVSPSGRAVFREALDPLDARYEAGTEPFPVGLRAPAIWKPQRWWWFRIPIQRDARLEQIALARLDAEETGGGL